MNQSESQQNLLDNEARASSVQSLKEPVGLSEYALSPVEKHFLLSAERGDVATVKRFVENYQLSFFTKVTFKLNKFNK